MFDKDSLSFPHNKSRIFYHRGKPVVPVSHPFAPVEIFKCPGELKYVSKFLETGEKTRVQLRSSSLHVFICSLCLLSTHCCPLIASFSFFTFVLWPFFPIGHSPLLFVHNVRLFIFHSCLLPCLFYFLLSSPSLFFFKDVYWTVSGPLYWRCFCFGHS